MELTDPQTGQIKTSVILVAGVGVLGVLVLLGSRSGGGQSGVVANGQSSGISDQLGALSGAVAGLAAQDAAGTGSNTNSTGNAAGSGTTGGGTNSGSTGTGSSTGTGGTGSGSTGAGSNTAGFGWLTNLINQIGTGAHRTNPTNPISPVTFPNGSAWANLPGGILAGLPVEGIIGSGDNGAYHNFISQYTGAVNVNSPQNTSTGTTNAGDTINRIINDIKNANFQDIPTTTGGSSGSSGSGSSMGSGSSGPSGGVGTVQNPNAPNPVPVSLFTYPAVPGLPSFSTQYSSILSQYQQYLQPNTQPIIPTIPSYSYNFSSLLNNYRTATIQPVP